MLNESLAKQILIKCLSEDDISYDYHAANDMYYELGLTKAGLKEIVLSHLRANKAIEIFPAKHPAHKGEIQILIRPEDLEVDDPYIKFQIRMDDAGTNFVAFLLSAHGPR